MSTFASRLKQCRLRAGLAQADLAGVCVKPNGDPISSSAVTQWEAGTSFPQIPNLIAIVELIRQHTPCSADYLLGLVNTLESMPAEDVALVTAFHCLTPADQEMVRTLIDRKVEIATLLDGLTGTVTESMPAEDVALATAFHRLTPADQEMVRTLIDRKVEIATLLDGLTGTPLPLPSMPLQDTQTSKKTTSNKR